MTSPSGSAVSESRSIFALTLPSTSCNTSAWNSLITSPPRYRRAPLTPTLAPLGRGHTASAPAPLGERVGVRALSQRLQDTHVIRDSRAAHVEDARGLGVLDLDAARRSRELHCR